MVRKVLVAMAASVMLSSAANASLLVNGSFELGSPQPSAGSFATLGAGNSSITGWTVSSGSIDWINGYWQAKDGTHSIDLAGGVPGGIEQTFNTVAGTVYSVNYWLSGNPDGGDIGKDGVVAAINGSVVDASSSITGIQGSTHANMNYSLKNFTFTASGNSTTLRFTSDPSESAYGAVIDMVTVAAVPEPTTWAMMLVGFGVVGASMRRRSAYRPAQIA